MNVKSASWSGEQKKSGKDSRTAAHAGNQNVRPKRTSTCGELGSVSSL
jgi:hypothetical protein